MRYLALLRGINVGGKNKVEMGRLRETFERVGTEDVRTYINTGNIIFSDDRPHEDLTDLLADAIEEDFGLRLDVLIRDIESIRETAVAIPHTWVTDKTMRTRVMFLWDSFDTPEVLDDLPVRDGVDEVMYVPGAVIWRHDAENANRSGQGRLVGTDLYRAMTVRNSNTVHKLAAMMEEPSAG